MGQQGNRLQQLSFSQSQYKVKRMRILSIDPGKTTGWCLTETHGDVYHVLECGVSESYSVPERVDSILKEGRLDLVVIEQPPAHGNSPDLLHLFGAVRALAQALHNEPIRTPMPGHWKPWAKKTNPYKPQGLRTKPIHVWDAYRMSLFALMCHNKEKK